MEAKAEGLFTKLSLGLANVMTQYDSSKVEIYLNTFTPIRDTLGRLFTNEEKVIFKNPNIFINVRDIKPYFKEYLKLLKLHIQFCDELTKNPTKIYSQGYIIELRILYSEFLKKIPENLKGIFKENLNYIIRLK